MTSTSGKLRELKVENLKIEVYSTREAMGQAAAARAAERLRNFCTKHETVGVVFATGASQLPMLEALTAIGGLPWDQVIGFHMDEYIGIPEDHRASFRRYLRENLTSKVPMREFHGMNGNGPDLQAVCTGYADLLRKSSPRLCLLGIGENGHLAFNDPAEANFEDPYDVRIVRLDPICRRQQVAEGWFGKLGEVPHQAITLTMPALTRIPELILTVPGPRKTEIVKRTLTGPISTAVPATILRRHPNVTVYLDAESAAETNA